MNNDDCETIVHSAQSPLSPFLPIQPRKKEGEDYAVLFGCLPFSEHQDDYQPDNYDCNDYGDYSWH